ncbi:MAG: hypothetical protein P4L93_04960 [Coriobacteriia bacterium]|nr:hypothetical protein [Coriobacteriia bacterium]
MEYGQIIKKAWRITWRYRFLWVLGIFAGITGWGGQGSGGYSPGQSFGSGSTSSGGSSTSPFSGGQLQQLSSTASRWIPVLIAAGLIWIVFALFMWVLNLAAQGGLVWAVNEIEDGRTPQLGSAWKQGFSRLWSVLGLGILVQLPLLVALLLLVAAVGVPIALAVARGGSGAVGAILPVCGSLVIGIPLILVMSFVLGIVYVIALRRIVLDGIGAIQSAKDAYKTFRARFKDTALMWLINWGLNVAAGLVVAIPIVIVTLVLLVPGIAAAVARNWGLVALLVGVWIIVLIAVSLFYVAVWGTFTSALWTILYRRMTGREIFVPQPGYIPPAYGRPIPPSYPTAPSASPAGYAVPPVAGWSPDASAEPSHE